MKIKFNSSGTHIHKDFLKVRFDLYPEPTDKTYSMHYVDHYDREPTQEELDNPVLLALVSTHKELNPCLCHFITIDPDMTVLEILTYLQAIFSKTILGQLDHYLAFGNAQIISYIMKDRSGTGKRISEAVDLDTLNTRFAKLEVKV